MPNEHKHGYRQNFSHVSAFDEKSNFIHDFKNNQSKLGAWIDKWGDKNYENDIRGSQIRELKYLVAGVLDDLRYRWKDFVGKPKEQNQSVGK